jgi:hypothetical protein
MHVNHLKAIGGAWPPDCKSSSGHNQETHRFPFANLIYALNEKTKDQS